MFVFLLVFASLISLLRWRYTMVMVIVIGFSQDVFRKAIEGEPRIFVVMVGVVFAAGLFALLMEKGPRALVKPYLAWSNSLYLPLVAFYGVVFVQFFHSLLRYGNPISSLIGLISYVAPLIAVSIGYYSVRTIDDIRGVMWVYFCLGLLLVISLYLSFQGLDWRIFKEVGAGLIIYDFGTILKSHAGIMRTGEMAAWHVATAACALVILFFSARGQVSYTLLVVALIIIVSAIFPTGRRKMFMMFSLFVMFYLILAAYFRRHLAGRFVVLSCGAGIVIYAAVLLLFPEAGNDSLNYYVSRGTSVYGDATNRFVSLGIDPVRWAYNRVGWLGGGVGIATQGAGYYSDVNIAGGAGEGGLGKIMVELGLPGLFVTFWLAVSAARYLFRIIELSALPGLDSRFLVITLGCVTFLAVNLLTFSVATQLYGDLFVLLILGTVVGLVLSMPRLIAEQLQNDKASLLAYSYMAGNYRQQGSGVS